MAAEMNHVRAMRLAEIIQDFRNLQHYIHQIRVQPPPPGSPEPAGEGYDLLQECHIQGQAILKAPFEDSAAPPNGDAAQEQAQLKQVILDASARRYQAQRVYLRATAAMRWINARNATLQDQKAGPARTKSLETLDKALAEELEAITDEKVVADLYSNDEQQGKWIVEDPSLAGIQQWLQSRE